MGLPLNDSLSLSLLHTHTQAGFPVLSDKPLTENVRDADELVQLVEKTGMLFGLTHNYTGYPMACRRPLLGFDQQDTQALITVQSVLCCVQVKEARELVKTGKLGQLRKVVVTYEQGWLTSEGGSITRTSGLSSLGMLLLQRSLAQSLHDIHIRSQLTLAHTPSTCWYVASPSPSRADTMPTCVCVVCAEIHHGARTGGTLR
jgi:hypothetical protein